MGKRGRWEGGDGKSLYDRMPVEKQKRLSWNETVEASRVFEPDFDINRDGDQVFRWIGMRKKDAETYFNDNIKPFVDFYENDGDYMGAITLIDSYIIDDYQFGQVVQDYRDNLIFRMDSASGYESIQIDSTDTETNVHDISEDRFPVIGHQSSFFSESDINDPALCDLSIPDYTPPVTGSAVTTSSGKQGVILSQSITSDGRNVSIVEFRNGKRVTKCACATYKLTVTKI